MKSWTDPIRLPLEGLEAGTEVLLNPPLALAERNSLRTIPPEDESMEPEKRDSQKAPEKKSPTKKGPERAAYQAEGQT